MIEWTRVPSGAARRNNRSGSETQSTANWILPATEPSRADGEHQVRSSYQIIEGHGTVGARRDPDDKAY
jgi:hypothetical protein